MTETPAPYLDAARVQTMFRDFDRLRQLITKWEDHEKIEEAWKRCEPWLAQLEPRTVPTRYRHDERNG